MSGVGAEPTVYQVGTARSKAGVEAWVFGLPGCRAIAPTRAAALEVLPVAIAEHLSWLDRHGDVTRNAFPFRFEVVEEVEASDDGDAVFADDLQPTSREDLEVGLRRLGFARKDLLEVVGQLPDTVLDWAAPEHIVGPCRYAARTIRAVLEHIAASDAALARAFSGTSDRRAAAGDQSPDIFGQRQGLIERLRALSSAELGREFRSGYEGSAKSGAELWTVRKALRYLIAHERSHTKEIEQRLAWLVLGLPHLPAATEVASHV